MVGWPSRGVADLAIGSAGVVEDGICPGSGIVA